MKHPIVINKFRLGDRSERIAALADEWGCSVTVATNRLLDAGLAAVDRDQKLTPDAIRRAFDLQSKAGGSGWGFAGPVSLDIQSDECTAPLPASQWPTLPDMPGKRMFDEAARHAVGHSLAVPGRLLTVDEVQSAIVNGMPPIRVDQSFWTDEPSQSDLDQAEFRAQYLNEFGAPLKHDFGLVITDATRDAMSGKGSFVLPGANDELCTDEACPGCGCLPGDGVTEGCTHPDGCGYYEDQDPRSMGWVGCDGLP